MKTPPFLLGAALLFWGWESGLLIPGAVMAVVLESTLFIKARWEFSEDDFRRIWVLCTLLVFGAFALAFANNQGPTAFAALFQEPGINSQRAVGVTGSRMAAAVFRWMPMLFFPFITAQTFSTRGNVPMEVVSVLMRWKWRKARRAGLPIPLDRGVNVAFPYFGLCVVAASIRPAAESPHFFWGFCLILAWALWTQRSQRFSRRIWIATMLVTLALGYFGQLGLGQINRLIEGYNPNWFGRYARGIADPTQARTSLGRIGDLKMSTRIVIRVEPAKGSQAPMYLREASYRVFDSPIWSENTFKEDFVTIRLETNRTTLSLLPDQTATATNSIACYLEGFRNGIPTGLLPLPSGVCRLERVPVDTDFSKNSAGAVMAEGPGLLIFDACNGRGATIDSPPDTNDITSVPEVEAAALKQTVAALNLSRPNVDEAIRAISRYFSGFTYRTWQDAPREGSTNSTPLSRFLMETHSGHCEFFATATVLLLRELGIPARYAVGYMVHETSGSGYVVRERDAHAWCLVWRNGTWEDFDTTPASWVGEENKHLSKLQFLSDGWEWIKFQFAKFRWGQSRWRQYLIYAIVPVMLGLLYQIFFKRNWRRQPTKPRKADTPVIWQGLDSEFYQLEKRLADHGFVRQPSEPLARWFERTVKDPRLGDLQAPLQTLLQLHYRHRFDPIGLAKLDREALRQRARECVRILNSETNRDAT